MWFYGPDWSEVGRSFTNVHWQWVLAALALPLINYGISYAQGFAFGIGLQAIETSVGIGYGLIFLVRESVGLATLRRTSAPDANRRR